MKILISDQKSAVWGSTRIYRDWLSSYLRLTGVDVVTDTTKGYDGYDVVIFGKGAKATDIQLCLKENSSVCVGIIHPDDSKARHRENLSLAHFFVVGSNEERDYFLRYCRNIIMFPQIEKIDVPKKIHIEKEQLIVGYHGNRIHLENSMGRVNQALEAISQKIDVEVRAFYNIESVGRWKNTPRVPVKHVQWSLPGVWQGLAECDLGIVPASVDISYLGKSLDRLPRRFFGKLSNEYHKRYKITSNAGRCFAFHQLGIPVIAGFVPSNFHVLGSPDCGYVADSAEGWYRGLTNLGESAKHRQDIADCASREFERNYNPLTWAERFISDLSGFLGQK